MNIETKIQEIRERVKQIDAEQEKLRDERRKCIIKAKRLEATLEHVNQILDEKTSAEDIVEISNNLK